MDAFLASQAAQFRRFADQECTEDPLYVALCRAIADEPGLLALMRHAPPTQARPNLLLAALHERVLAGSRQDLREYYPSVGGQRKPDADPLWAWLKDKKRGVLGTESIKWNFTKFLVGRDGRVLQRFAPMDSPDKLRPAIEEALGK